MAEQTDAADLPVGSIVVDDVVGVAFYAVEEMGIEERWHESDTLRGNATVDHAIRKRDAQIVRVGTEAAVAPDARERLARHLWIADGRTAFVWDDRKSTAATLREASLDVAARYEMQFVNYLVRADQILAVITGQEN